jgi:hypothetical protein
LCAVVRLASLDKLEDGHPKDVRMLVHSSLSTPRLVVANRRAAVRVPAHDLQWLRRVRLVDGPAVSLIDLSASGASFEIGLRVRPGDAVTFELAADNELTVSTTRIVRSEIAEVTPEIVKYRSAGAFTDPFPWIHRLPASETVRECSIRGDLDYQPWSGWSETRVVFRHGGQRLKGYSRGFRPSQGTIEVWPSRIASSANRHVVPLALVRAVLFTQDFADGDVIPPDDRERVPSPSHVQVAFKNNQVVEGLLPGYDAAQIGFWLIPLKRDVALRVFAVAAAVAEIRVYPD